MKTIKNKIQQLLTYNLIAPVYTFKSTAENSLENIMKKQEALMDELKALAKADATVLGRTMKFPMADSYALYVITKVNKKTVELQWIKYCDAWVDDRLGYVGTCNKEYAENHIQGMDKIAELFAAKKKSVPA